MNKIAGEKPGLGELMKKAQEMQKKMQEIQKQIAETETTGQAGGGMVKIIFIGQKVKRVILDPALKKEDETFIADLIAAAFNDGMNKIEKNTREKMSLLTGIKLPDGFDLPTDT